MKVSCDHAKIKHLSNGHGKKMTRKAVIKVIKDDLQDVVRFTHTQQMTIEVSSAQLANNQLPGIQTWNKEINPMHDHPDVSETNVGRLMDNIMKLQPSKHYTVIPFNGIE